MELVWRHRLGRRSPASMSETQTRDQNHTSARPSPPHNFTRDDSSTSSQIALTTSNIPNLATSLTRFSVPYLCQAVPCSLDINLPD